MNHSYIYKKLLPIFLIDILKKDEKFNIPVKDKFYCQDYDIKFIQYVKSYSILNYIKRHRLVNFFKNNEILLRFFPDIKVPLKLAALEEIKNSLSLISLTSYMASNFEKANLPALFFKGIPLSIQAYEASDIRGGGDLDIFINPLDLEIAIKLIESNGFLKLKGKLTNNLKSLLGRYSIFTGYEISFYRKINNRYQWVDLHWALSNVRGNLPNFETAWNNRVFVHIANQKIPTLSIQDSFHLSCAHAAKDQWGIIRNLIDINTLAQKINLEKANILKNYKAVKWSTYVVYNLTKDKKLKIYFNKFNFSFSWILTIAKSSRSLPNGLWLRSYPWKIKNYIFLVLGTLIMSANIIDFLRSLLYFILVPSEFVDPKTGNDYKFFSFLRNRFLSIKKKLFSIKHP